MFVTALFVALAAPVALAELAIPTAADLGSCGSGCQSLLDWDKAFCTSDKLKDATCLGFCEDTPSQSAYDCTQCVSQSSTIDQKFKETISIMGVGIAEFCNDALGRYNQSATMSYEGDVTLDATNLGIGMPMTDSSAPTSTGSSGSGSAATITSGSSSAATGSSGSGATTTPSAAASTPSSAATVNKAAVGSVLAALGLSLLL